MPAIIKGEDDGGNASSGDGDEGENCRLPSGFCKQAT